MLNAKKYEFWFCTGSQDLYGDECLAHVAEHSWIIVDELNRSGNLPFEVVLKPTLITNELIRKTLNEANNDENCAGVITWMPFPRPNPGFWDFRSTASPCCTCIPSSTARSPTTPLTWTS